LRDFDLTTLRLFVAVCETGNMARAGERAHIVGSAISKRLAQLEDQVGTPLLLRRRHGVIPTPAGNTVLEHARSMLDSAARIARDMESYVAGTRGKVRVLASVSAMTESLAEDVAAFLHMPAHRTTQVDLEERISPEIVRGVQEGLASLGVCWDAVDLGTLQSRRYRSDHLCVVVPQGHMLAQRKRLRFAETLDFEQVGLPVTSAVQQSLQRAAAELGHTLVNRIVVSNFEAALRVVSAGLAISLVPREVVGRKDAAHAVRIIALAESWAERRFVICFRNASELSPSAQSLVEHLVAKAS